MKKLLLCNAWSIKFNFFLHFPYVTNRWIWLKTLFVCFTLKFSQNTNKPTHNICTFIIIHNNYVRLRWLRIWRNYEISQNFQLFQVLLTFLTKSQSRQVVCFRFRVYLTRRKANVKCLPKQTSTEARKILSIEFIISFARS